MKRRILNTILTIVIVLPFLINLFGWNIYTYLNFGDRDLILASALGVSHNAWAEHYESDVVLDIGLPDDFTKTVVDLVFINIFLERRGDQMTPFTFRWFIADEYSDYRGFEFPWLLFLFIPAVIMLAPKLKRMQNNPIDRTSQAQSGHG